MSSLLRLLDSDRVTPFVSHSYGNILAGSSSTPKLLFVDCYGTEDCPDSEIGIEAVAGNDGYMYSEICQGAEMDASAITIGGTVYTTGGSIASGTLIEYEVTVKDRWGHESAPNPVSYQPSFVTGVTNKVDITWDADADAYTYVLYSNISGAGYYKVAEVSTNSYSDLTALNDGVTSPPVGGSVAYKMGSWVTTPIALGTLTAGEIIPVGKRETIPGGSTADANPRQDKMYVAFGAV